MSAIDLYLDEGRRALAARGGRILGGAVSPIPLAAGVTVEGRSGVRRIGIRRHAVVTDSLPDFAGSDLGPGSPELQRGVPGACLAHTVLIQAALHDVPVTALEVEVSGIFDPRAGSDGFEEVPVHPQDLTYELRLDSPADPARVQALHAQAEAAGPILNPPRLPQAVSGHWTHAAPASRADALPKETIS